MEPIFTFCYIGQKWGSIKSWKTTQGFIVLVKFTNHYSRS